MTRYGLEVFLFTLAVFLGVLSLFLSPLRDETELRMKNPEVVVSNPYWKKVKKLSTDFARDRIIYELLRLGAYISGEEFLVENADKEKVMLKMKKLGLKYEFVNRNVVRIISYSIVVLLK